MISRILNTSKYVGNASISVESIASILLSQLRYILYIVPGGSHLVKEIDQVHDTIIETTANSDPKKFDPATSKLSSGPEEIWKIMKPAFVFHDRVARFLIEYDNDIAIPFVGDVAKKVSKSIDNLLDAMLAIIVEPAVDSVRESIKFVRKQIEMSDRESREGENIFNDDSTVSDPSHTVRFNFVSTTE